jgi:D-alanyl-D-alanine carboxypeptidase
MTAYVIFQLLERFSLNENKELIKILPNITSLNGTSACLLPCDMLTVIELLHGMMLPSGNDAAQALAIHFGLLIMREKITAMIKKAGGI